MNNVVFIVGPTAAGKSEAAYSLARRLKAEIISADSMLVYKEPLIITAKPSSAILTEIPHHFVGIISVKQEYNVFDYCRDASAKIEALGEKNIPVIVCGGTGLYIKALLDGIFEGAGKDEKLRKQLEKKAEVNGRKSLHEELKKIDSKAAEKISPNDLKRIIRALEVYYTQGALISDKKKEAKGFWGKIPIKIFGLRMDRGLLYERINKRVDEMFENGAVEEVKKLLKMNLSFTAAKVIGIKEIRRFLEGNISEEEAKELMKKNTRNFAKRQLTWFRKDKRIEWVDVEGGGERFFAFGSK